MIGVIDEVDARRAIRALMPSAFSDAGRREVSKTLGRSGFEPATSGLRVPVNEMNRTATKLKVAAIQAIRDCNELQ